MSPTTLVYWRLLCLVLAASFPFSSSRSFETVSVSSLSNTTAPITTVHPRNTTSSTKRPSSTKRSRTTVSQITTTTSQAPPSSTEPPSRTEPQRSTSSPRSTSVSDGNTLPIALGALGGGLVVAGGVGGGFIAFGSRPPIPVAAGQVVELLPDGDDDGDEPEVPQNYIVTLKTQFLPDVKAIDDFEEFLRPFARPGTLEDLAEKFDSGGQLGVFALDTTEDEAAEIGKDPRVFAITLNDELDDWDQPFSPVASRPEVPTLEPIGDSVVQTNAQPALAAISLPLELNAEGYTPSNYSGYVYPKEAGKGVTVYLIDTGANPNHREFKDAKGTKRWLFATQDRAERDGRDHGSCTQSLVNGPMYGSAKEADIVIVSIGPRPEMENIISAMILVYLDVVKNKLQGKAVVNASVGTRLLAPATNTRGETPGFIDQQKVATYKSALQLLVDEDVVFVTASGNGKDDPNNGNYITDLPAWLGREMDIITVGAVNLDGKRVWYSQGVPRELDTSAVGNVVCASNFENADTEAFGTSVAAPAVAGMVAVLLSQEKYRGRLQVPGKVAANVKQLVRELSYNRFGGGDTPVAWNGEDGVECQSNPGGLQARAGSCVINRTSTAIPAPTQTAVPNPVIPPNPPATPSASSAPTIAPVPCYNFNINAYGWCCPTETSACALAVGTCWLPFRGEGVGGGGNGQTLVPSGARCPPPPGAKDNW
ncbi:subtilisin-like protein [Colletotrichum zoysiae]|uniref:Subtilisin-like protein n=1 Tax=Colletotrichum zoysiae TaxID=1216348 RepID=A0AAD9HEY3_9PEZI|nr:subtilisin-like protein [Colletotrichum zoysiae]